AQVTATANLVAGGYGVTATAAGADPVDFALTNLNLVQAVFSGLTSPSIVFGTATATVSGTIAAGSKVPMGETVAVTLNGLTQQATIGFGGAFSATFDTSGLGVVSPYTVQYAYAGDATIASAGTTSTLTVTRATPTVTVVDAGGTYSGSAF